MRKRATVIGIVIGVVGLGLTALGLKVAPTETAWAYLIGYAYWASIVIGGLLLLQIMYASDARWFVVLKRPMEAVVSTFPILLVLFIPIIFFIPHLYPWAQDISKFDPHVQELLRHKAPYLNETGFIIRAAIYFAIFLVCGEGLIRFSRRQDANADDAAALRHKMRALGSVGIPFTALALTFASFDWLMSLTPVWYSTIYGAYIFGGGFMGAVSLVVIISWLAHREGGPLSSYANSSHFHNMGKLMLVFVIFWAYMAFSQLIIMYEADLPVEVPFFLVRGYSSWGIASLVLLFGHFFIPFFILLNFRFKRVPYKLAAVAVWLLIIHYIDINWLVLPVLHPSGLHYHWVDFTAWIGLGGLVVAFGALRMQKQAAVAENEPFLKASISYRSV